MLWEWTQRPLPVLSLGQPPSLATKFRWAHLRTEQREVFRYRNSKSLKNWCPRYELNVRGLGNRLLPAHNTVKKQQSPCEHRGTTVMVFMTLGTGSPYVNGHAGSDGLV